MASSSSSLRWDDSLDEALLAELLDPQDAEALAHELDGAAALSHAELSHDESCCFFHCRSAHAVSEEVLEASAGSHSAARGYGAVQGCGHLLRDQRGMDEDVWAARRPRTSTSKATWAAQGFHDAPWNAQGPPDGPRAQEDAEEDVSGRHGCGDVSRSCAHGGRGIAREVSLGGRGVEETRRDVCGCSAKGCGMADASFGTVAASAGCSLFGAMIRHARMDDELPALSSHAEPTAVRLTVFAPSDAALAALSAATWHDEAELRSLLLLHVCAGELPLADAGCVEGDLLSLIGHSHRLRRHRDGSLSRIGNAGVAAIPVPFSSGTIYVIDSVLWGLELLVSCRHEQVWRKALQPAPLVRVLGAPPASAMLECHADLLHRSSGAPIPDALRGGVRPVGGVSPGPAGGLAFEPVRAGPDKSGQAAREHGAGSAAAIDCQPAATSHSPCGEGVLIEFSDLVIETKPVSIAKKRPSSIVAQSAASNAYVLAFSLYSASTHAYLGGASSTLPIELKNSFHTLSEGEKALRRMKNPPRWRHPSSKGVPASTPTTAVIASPDGAVAIAATVAASHGEHAVPATSKLRKGEATTPPDSDTSTAGTGSCATQTDDCWLSAAFGDLLPDASSTRAACSHSALVSKERHYESLAAGGGRFLSSSSSSGGSSSSGASSCGTCSVCGRDGTAARSGGKCGTASRSSVAGSTSTIGNAEASTSSSRKGSPEHYPVHDPLHLQLSRHLPGQAGLVDGGISNMYISELSEAASEVDVSELASGSDRGSECLCSARAVRGALSPIGRPPPSLLDLSVVRGPSAGGTMVWVQGEGLDAPGLSVYFAGRRATLVAICSAQLVKCRTPPCEMGKGEVERVVKVTVQSLHASAQPARHSRPSSELDPCPRSQDDGAGICASLLTDADASDTDEMEAVGVWGDLPFTYFCVPTPGHASGLRMREETFGDTADIGIGDERRLKRRLVQLMRDIVSGAELDEQVRAEVGESCLGQGEYYDRRQIFDSVDDMEGAEASAPLSQRRGGHALARLLPSPPRNDGIGLAHLLSSLGCIRLLALYLLHPAAAPLARDRTSGSALFWTLKHRGPPVAAALLRRAEARWMPAWTQLWETREASSSSEPASSKLAGALVNREVTAGRVIGTTQSCITVSSHDKSPVPLDAHSSLFVTRSTTPLVAEEALELEQLARRNIRKASMVQAVALNILHASGGPVSPVHSLGQQFDNTKTSKVSALDARELPTNDQVGVSKAVHKFGFGMGTDAIDDSKPPKPKLDSVARTAVEQSDGVIATRKVDTSLEEPVQGGQGRALRKKRLMEAMGCHY